MVDKGFHMTVQHALSHTDVETIRGDFPVLQREFHGKRLTYLDSSATSQKPRAVLDAMMRYYETSNANVHRGVYALAEEATAQYEGARDRIATFINASPQETIFTRNATEAINLVAYSWGLTNLHPGDTVVLTPLEHHSNLVPWQLIAERTGADVAYVDLTPEGSLDLDSLDRLLTSRTVRLVSTTYISNVLGTRAPVEEIGRRAHAAGALYLVDGAQAVPHMPVDVRALDVDFLAFTGHKMVGPMGIGVLYGRRELLEAMPPFLGGGEMIRRVGYERSTWNDLPWKFEAGTPSVGDAIGLGAAVEYLQAVGLDRVQEHDARLVRYAVERLSELPGLTILGPRERGALVAFSLGEIHPHDIASLLDEDAIAVRAGHHCAQPLHDSLGIAASTRASFYLYNDESDIDRLVQGLHRVMTTFAA
jgi:cysteine desulfurase/selenocysteine lyase